jgi:hypothetical protein
MEPLTIGFLTASALGAAGNFAGRLLGADARRNEINQRIQALQFKKEQVLSTTQARAGASGILSDSKSVEEYLASLSGQFDKEISALKRSGQQGFLADILGAGFGAVGDVGHIFAGYGAIK